MGKQLGTVAQTRGFQIAEYVSAHSNFFDGDLIWTPKLPSKLTPVKSRVIYAFAFVDDQKAFLKAEYTADENGKLTFVPGDKRRTKEANAAPKGVPVPEASLPLVEQGKAVRYAFVITRGRMSMKAISLMENSLDPIYRRLDLADPDRFTTDASQKSFIVAVDLLTIIEGLQRAYFEARNEAINYVTVHSKNTHNAEVEIRTRKFQLAKMINDSLLDGGTGDPLGISKYLAGGGSTLKNFIATHESEVAKRVWAGRNAALELVRMHTQTSALTDTRTWYLGDNVAKNTVGHLWLDVIFRSLDRLSETPEGRAYQRRLVEDARTGLLSFAFCPPDDDEDAWALFKDRYPIFRKAATAVIVGFAEMAPALIVHSRVREAARKKIIDTIAIIFEHSEAKLTFRSSRGRVVGILKLTRETWHIEIDVKSVEADIKELMEGGQGKPHWPEGTRLAERAELWGRFLLGVEMVNYFIAVTNLIEKPKTKTAWEFTGATLDLIVALEDPIRAWAKAKDAARAERAALRGAAEGGAEHAAVGGAAAEGGAEAEVGLFGKLTAPAVFKALGAVSAGIDAYWNMKEGREYYGRGDRGVAAGYFAISGGSALICSASIFNAAGYISQVAALTAASATLLVVGVVIVFAGYMLIMHFSTSEWQKFARHSVFGDAPGSDGNEIWSGGNFSKWTADKDGLDRQILVLTSMLCAFKVSGTFKMRGHGSDAESIFVEFESLAPQSKLMLDFHIEYVGGRLHRPSYAIDLETQNVECSGEAKTYADLQPWSREDRLHSVLLSADRPPGAEGARVANSRCTVRVRYGPPDPKTKVATGSIPIGEPVEYIIYNGYENLKEVSSLKFDPEDVEKKEGEKEGGGAEAPEEHRAEP
jgi:hypothetical protein